MTNELVTLEQASKEIDKIVMECIPYASNGQMSTFSQTLALAKGIDTLRQIFEHPDIKATVMAMKDTRLGFLTDRSDKALARAKKDNKPLYPYSYDDIKEACIEAMLKGFRISNNEFNIIAGNFYPAKEGKYRKIIEHPEVTDFIYTTTSPAYEPDGKYAKVQCFASWKKNGVLQTIGTSDQNQNKVDTLMFRIRVNAAMGEDAIVGKALSKLFGRVLSRIEGKALTESSDLEYEAIDIAASPLADDPTAKIHAAHATKMKEKAHDPGPEHKGQEDPPPPEEEKASKKGKGFDYLKEMGELKKEIIALDGNDDSYYQALSIYDAKKSPEVKDSHRFAIVSDLHAYIDGRKIDGPPEE